MGISVAIGVRLTITTLLFYPLRHDWARFLSTFLGHAYEVSGAGIVEQRKLVNSKTGRRSSLDLIRGMRS